VSWIGVDLDGTLAKHYWPEDGPYDPLRIGEPIPAMVGRVKCWLALGQEVRIFTARVGPQGSLPRFSGENQVDIEAIYKAIWDWSIIHIGASLQATCTKDYEMAELWDDRAIRVVHNTGHPCCGHSR
jgi:hypothetical protein